jgi:hypothetical protein
MFKKKTYSIYIIIISVFAFSGCGQNSLETEQAKNNAMIWEEKSQTSTDEKNKEKAVQWKKYANDDLGFEFEYPGDLVFKEEKRDGLTIVSFYKGNETGPLLLNISLKKGPRWSLAQREQENKKIKEETITTERISFHDVPALKTKYSGNEIISSADEIYFMKNNNTFILTFMLSGEPNISSDEGRISDSFKFKNQ